MARSDYATIQDLTPQENLSRGYSFEELPEGFVEVHRVVDGMYTTIPRDQRPAGSLLVGQNLRMEDDADWIGRREGSTTLGTAPDSNTVLLVLFVLNENGDLRILRVTPSTMHITHGDGTWYSITNPMSGYTNPIASTFFLGKVYLVNGVDKVVEVDLEARTADTLDDSPTGLTQLENYAERLVGSKESTLYWSANADVEDWSSEDAGFEPLIQVAGDIANTITGIHSFGTELAILRQNSVWHASRQPFAIAPFRFRQVIAGLGCDLPYSSVRIPGGVMYTDAATGSVYLYSPGSRPQKVSQQIHSDILHDISEATWVRGTYIPHHGAYVLGEPAESGNEWITKLWKYYLNKQAWVYDEIPDASTLSILYTESVTTIDDLAGTIDALSGSIDSLSGDTGIKILNVAGGAPDGKVWYYDEDQDTDWESSSFTHIIQGQNLGSLSRERTLKNIAVELDVQRGGDIVLEHAVVDGTWRNSKSKTLTTGVQQVDLKRPISGPNLYWRLTGTGGDVRLQGFWAKIMERAPK